MTSISLSHQLSNVLKYSLIGLSLLVWHLLLSKTGNFKLLSRPAQSETHSKIENKIRTIEDESKEQTTCKRCHPINRMKLLMLPDLYINDKKNCLTNKETKWSMVMFIESAITHFQRRKMIRETWGSVLYLNGSKFHVVFVIGTKDEETQLLVNEEQKKHHDVMQIDVIDSYGSLGNKSLSVLQWASEKLPEDFYFTKMDDDVFVDNRNLKQVLEYYIAKMNDPENPWPVFPIMCTFKYRAAGARAIRHRKNKNWVPKKDYLWWNYPAFCRGPMYTTRVDTVRQLWNEAKTSVVLHNIEDVWVTGVLRLKIGMPEEMLVVGQEKVAHDFTNFDKEDFTAYNKLWEKSKVYLQDTCLIN